MALCRDALPWSLVPSVDTLPSFTKPASPAIRSTSTKTSQKAVRCSLRKTLDIIGDSVYLLYANLCDLTRQAARVPGRDRTDARRVCTCAAGLCGGLCRTLSARQDLGRQGAPTPERRRRQRRLAADGRQAALHPRLPEDQSAANHARLAIRSEPAPNQLLDSSLAPRLATGLNHSRRGAGARREPGCHQPPRARGSSRWGHRRHRAPSPTSHRRRTAKGTVQRQEENAYGQEPLAGQRT